MDKWSEELWVGAETRWRALAEETRRFDNLLNLLRCALFGNRSLAVTGYSVAHIQDLLLPAVDIDDNEVSLQLAVKRGVEMSERYLSVLCRAPRRRADYTILECFVARP